MDTTEIKGKLLELLKARGTKDTHVFSDQELCTALGEPDYEKIYAVLLALKDEGLILFYHAPNGASHIGLIG